MFSMKKTVLQIIQKTKILTFLYNHANRVSEKLYQALTYLDNLDESVAFENELSKFIAIDFDGTLTVKNAFPEIGEPNWAIIKKAKERAKKGYILILHTCREEIYLDNAIKACKKWGVPITYVNENPEHTYYKHQRKIVANEYWDDRAINVTNNRLLPTKLMGNNKHIDILKKKGCKK